jgi:L-asparaginase
MKICVIATGGTIDKDYPKSIGGYAFEFGEPAVKRMLHDWQTNIEFEILSPFQKDSLEINDSDRKILLESLSTTDSEMVVITHGTDTMIETGKFLSTKSLNKKIIITGAMRPQRFSNSDAALNFGGAIAALQIVDKGVYIYINGLLKKAMAMQRNVENGRFF